MRQMASWLVNAVPPPRCVELLEVQKALGPRCAFERAELRRLAMAVGSNDGPCPGVLTSAIGCICRDIPHGKPVKLKFG